MRQEGDASYGGLLWRLHEADDAQGEEDWQMLNARALPYLSASEQQFSARPEVLHIFAEKPKAQAANLKDICEGYTSGAYRAVAHVPARRSPSSAQSAGSDKAMRLKGICGLQLGV